MIRHKKISHRVSVLFPKLGRELKKDKFIIFSYIFGSYGEGKAGFLSEV